jgi:hypothetical protein
MIPGAGIMERRERNMVMHSIFSKPPPPQVEGKIS